MYLIKNLLKIEVLTMKNGVDGENRNDSREKGDEYRNFHCANNVILWLHDWATFVVAGERKVDENCLSMRGKQHKRDCFYKKLWDIGNVTHHHDDQHQWPKELSTEKHIETKTEDCWTFLDEGFKNRKPNMVRKSLSLSPLEIAKSSIYFSSSNVIKLKANNRRYDHLYLPNFLRQKRRQEKDWLFFVELVMAIVQIYVITTNIFQTIFDTFNIKTKMTNRRFLLD